MTRAVVPETMDDGKWFKVNRTKGEVGFSEGESGVDDKVEGYYGNP